MEGFRKTVPTCLPMDIDYTDSLELYSFMSLVVGVLSHQEEQRGRQADELGGLRDRGGVERTPARKKKT